MRETWNKTGKWDGRQNKGKEKQGLGAGQRDGRERIAMDCRTKIGELNIHREQ